MLCISLHFLCNLGVLQKVDQARLENDRRKDDAIKMEKREQEALLMNIKSNRSTTEAQKESSLCYSKKLQIMPTRKKDQFGSF